MIQKLLTSLRLILITLALYLAVAAFYKLITARLDIDAPPASVAKAIAVPEDITRPPFTHYQPIVDRNLFQTKSKSLKSEIQKTSVQLDNLKETKLKLKLWGTVAGSEKQAYAVIEEEKSRKQNLYKIGDTLQNATVKMILRNKVILSVRGKDEILEMEKTARAGASGRSTVRTAARRAPTHRRPTPKRRIRLSRSHINDAMDNLNVLMGQINIRPNMVDGNPEGMILSNIKPSSLFRRMGLRNGDILIGVDDRPIESVDDAWRLYENLKSKDRATVQIKRKGRPTIIEYSIK